MKYLLIILLGTFCFSATAQNINQQENTIKQNAQQFMKALISENYDEAKQFSTEGTNQMIEQIKMFASMVPDSLQPQMKAAREKAMQAKLTFGNITFHNETTCSMQFTSSVDPTKEETISFRKVDSKWLVDLSIGMPEDTNADEVTEEEVIMDKVDE